MPRYEYKVIPTPKRAEKVKGIKASEERFAHTLMEVMNNLGKDGWEYMRADTLPVETRTGLTSKSIVDQTILVFRRELTQEPMLLNSPVENTTTHNAPTLPGARADEEKTEAPRVKL